MTEQEPFRQITEDDAQAMLASNQVRVIDVREPWEFASGHIPGAQNVPLQTFLRAARQLVHPEEHLLFVCATGHRSAVACEMALAMGCKDVYNLSNGTEGWRKKGLPVEK